MKRLILRICYAIIDRLEPREVCTACGSDWGCYVPPGSGDAFCLKCGDAWRAA